MKKTILRGAVVGAAASLALAGSPAFAISGTSADLSVLHAIPDTPVDVWVNGELTLDDFAPGDLAGPLDLPAGAYSIVITAPDATDISSPVIGPVDVTLAANTSYTAVAHLTEAGEPSATLFTNDLSTTAPGEGRLTVRHTAAAPAVDILAGGTAVVSGLVNPKEASLDLPVSTVSAAVALAGTTQPVIGPADVPITEGTNTIVYAWGSAEDGNLALAVQTISGLHSSPDGVNTGEAGLAATGGSSPLLALAALVGILAVGATGAALALRRAPSTGR
ncbi:DUF4397 domain-containing protein [Amnibacterium flavum]|uniref:DUF4397 domain-containing protein n=1 Tax=Amnibacterium flavum TaxID=2173173 RepID=A0A2V1HV64_9MICO|nr:DUF4397 domain-containing protein [Amnibacterium flavum]PVZ94004.1 hypothetical protein DDQ50_09615 [Amnibacterium flavum]